MGKQLRFSTIHALQLCLGIWACLVFLTPVAHASNTTSGVASVGNTRPLGLSQPTAVNALPQPIQDHREVIGIDEALGKNIDSTLTFRNESGVVVPLSQYLAAGKPTILLLAYYSCPSLCGLFLNGVLDSFSKFDWLPGEKFQVVTVSFDATEDPSIAGAKRENYIAALREKIVEWRKQNGDSKVDTALEQKLASIEWHFLTNYKTLTEKQDSLVVEKLRTQLQSGPELDSKLSALFADNHSLALADQVGFKFWWDEKNSQFNHTSAMVLLSPSGKVSRYLYGIHFPTRDLKLALVEAGENKVGSVIDRLVLFCYHYDPADRKYALYAINLMKSGGALTILFLSFFIFKFFRRGRVEEKLANR